MSFRHRRIRRPRQRWKPSLSRRGREHLAIACGLALLSAAIFAPHLKAPFLYDDISVIVQNDAVRHMALSMRRVLHSLGVPRAQWETILLGAKAPPYSILSPDYWSKVHIGTRGVYRPLREMMFAVIYAAFGPHAVAFHAVNLLMHIGVVLLVYSLGLALLKDRPAAAVGAAFFAVHPVHIEAIQWAKDLAEVFCGLALASSLLLFLRAAAPAEDDSLASGATGRPAARRRAFMILALAFYGAGMLAKETTLALPAIITLVAATGLRPPWRRRALAWSLPFWGVGLVYIAFQFASFDLSSAVARGMAKVPNPDEGMLLRPALVAKTYAWYFRLLLWPIPLAAQHHFHFPTDYLGAVTWPYLLGFAGVVAAAIWLFWVRREWLALLAWPFACLAPVSNLIPFRGRPIGEQRLYAPSIGLCLMFGAAYQALARGRAPRRRARAAAGLFLAAFVVFLAQSLDRIRIWDNPHAFWKDLVRKSPIQTAGNSALAKLYLESDLPLLALVHCDLAFKYYDTRQYEADYFPARLTQGEAFERLERYDEALESYRSILKRRPDDAEPAIGIGRVQGRQGRHDLALQTFLEVIRKHPDKPDGYRNAGRAHGNLGRYPESLAALLKARELFPGDLSLTVDIAKTLGHMERPEEARHEFEDALRQAHAILQGRPYDPDVLQLWLETALALGRQEEAQAAVERLRKLGALP